MREKRRAAVIGAGFGGLALAIRLQSAGIATTIVEARDKPGGRAYVWEKEGFTFDAGPTVVTDPACLRELWSLSGRDMADDITLLPVMPFYRLNWPDGTNFDYSNDEPVLNHEIARLNPADVDGYRRFLAYSEGVYEEGYVKLGAVPFLDFASMIRAAPALARYQAWRSVYSMVSSFVADERLREALSFHTLLVGGNPMTTSAIYALIHKLEKDGGVWFAKGGTNALIRAMVTHFERLGGVVRLNDPVVEIETLGDKVTGVRTASGWQESFDAVASNGDIVHSYRDLLPNSARGQKVAASLVRKKFSPSLFVVHFGIQGTWPDIPHHMILFGQRYRELLTDIYDRGVLASDFSLYLHHPTVSDPSLAPEGCSTFYALAPVPHMGKLPVDWDEVGPIYAERILDEIERRLIPDIRSRIVTQFHYSPADFGRDLNAHLGSAFSLEPTLTQSAWFRVHNRDDKIPNLYFVGAGTHPGAGIPGVVGSAKATAGLMIHDLAHPRLVRFAQDPIARGSKSFAAASLLFDRPTRERAWLLYAWCRAADDLADGQEMGHGMALVTDPGERLARIRTLTEAALVGDATGEPAFDALGVVVRECRIPHHYVRDVIEGFALDADGFGPRLETDLYRYCYHVAGAVGCMMAVVMGVDPADDATLDRACDLGIAFQLANIARDLAEDAAAGRCYLPLDWLVEMDIPPGEEMKPHFRPRLAILARRLADRAEAHEASARFGTRALGFRSAWAVLAAAGIYGDIAREVRARGTAAWDHRVTTSRGEKLGWVARALLVTVRRGQIVDPGRTGLYQRPAGAVR